jgi:lysophospholipase L1-like esterase
MSLTTGHIVITKSKRARRLLLIAVSVIFTLFLIEFPAWIDVLDYRTLIGPSHAWWAPNIFDRELLHIHRAHAHQSGRSLGGDAASAYQIPPSDKTVYQWKVKYDQNGFRNEVDLKRADVVVIGDSFVEGLTVPTEQLTTSVLARLSGQVVANLGQSAYGPLEEMVVLKRYGLPLRPRTVVWMFFEGNDLQDVTAYRQAMRNPPNFWRAFVARSFTRSAVHEVHYLVSPPARLIGTKRSAVLQMPNGEEAMVYFIYSPKPITNENLTALDDTVRTLANAHQLLAAQGARLVFVFIPSKFRVFHPFCRFDEESEVRSWTPNDMSERLEKALESISTDIGYLDLTPSLVDAMKSGALPYYPDDEHWSPEGHKVAAEAINAYLLEARHNAAMSAQVLQRDAKH